MTNTIDCNSNDREIMRAMLRYMNIGPGAGQRWDADKFTSHHCASNRGSVLCAVKENVERCYNLLINSQYFRC